MKNKIRRVKSTLLPCVLLSAITGIVAGLLIFVFKLAAIQIVQLSTYIYSVARNDPRWIPLLVAGAALLGLLSALILKNAKQCRGGGIPTAVASIRGIVPLRWLQSIFVLFATSMLTYLSGVPLGSEGPSVQMGTAAGKGSAEVLTKKNRIWERYLMTGGACAGFATALGAPLTGILLAVEEIHRRFSPMIFTTAAISVFTATITQELLSMATGIDVSLFHFPAHHELPLKLLWVSLFIGLLCGLLAILFTKLYGYIRRLNRSALKNLPFTVKIVIVFAASALLGILCEDFIGSGHHLIDKILQGNAVWYVLLAALGIRAVLMLTANCSGITGGMFIPILTFGAIVSALISETLCRLGVVEELNCSVLIAMGMAAFLAAAYRTPLTALAFALEVLCGIGNILPIGIAVAVAYLVIEVFKIPSFNDTVIEAKTEAAHACKTPIVVDIQFTVTEGAFAIGQEVRDILWPPTCTVPEIDKKQVHSHPDHAIEVGDVVHLHYQTFEPAQTMAYLEQLLGRQTERTPIKAHFGKENEDIPAD